MKLIWEMKMNKFFYKYYNKIYNYYFIIII